MTETQTEVVETEDAETGVDTELGVGAMVEEIAATDQAGATKETADTVTTDDDFEPTETQMKLAKQLGFDDDYVSNMTEAQAEAADQWGRKQSAYHQRKGKVKSKEVETVVDAESSTDDDEFTEEDWFTDEGREKINAVMKAQKAGNQTQQNTDKERLKAEANKVFDGLPPEFFPDFLPGESELIEPNSPAEELRTKTLRIAKTIQATSESVGTKITLEKAIGQALLVTAETETQNAAEHAANDKRRKRGGQRLGSPASSKQTRKKTYDSPHDEAIDRIHEAVNG